MSTLQQGTAGARKMHDNVYESLPLLPPWNRKIESDKKVLGATHACFPWIPGEHQIRPSLADLEKKASEMIRIECFYRTITDFIYDFIFDFKTCLDSSGKLYVPELAMSDRGVDAKPSKYSQQRKVFAPNAYPYKVSQGTQHSLMWYSDGSPGGGDSEINADIYSALASELGHEQFEYVWYENPKMTIPGVYHVQVFWHVV